MAYLVVLKCHLKEGVKEAFMENLRGETGAILARGFPGNRGVVVGFSPDDPEHDVIIQQRWVSPECAKAYFKMRADGNSEEWKATFFTKPPKVTKYWVDDSL
jgi:hypothetical protein